MNITGKLIEKFETQQIKDTFRKREFVVEFAENPQYPELIKFELIQTNCELLDPFQVGEELNVSFNLKGRKWTDKNGQAVYFNTLQAWRLERAQGSAPAGDTPPPPTQEWQPENFTPDDDLPF